MKIGIKGSCAVVGVCVKEGDVQEIIYINSCQYGTKNETELAIQLRLPLRPHHRATLQHVLLE